MNTSTRFLLAGVSMIFAVVLTACDKKPAETAGESIDQAINKTGNKMSDTSKAIGKQTGKVGVILDDTAITTKVKAAILAERDLDSLQIGVDTVKGVTTLSGSADSKQNKNRAEKVAATVSGVKSVKNNLVVDTASKGD